MNFLFFWCFSTEMNDDQMKPAWKIFQEYKRVLNWTELIGWTGLNWVKLGQTGLNSIVVNCTQLGLIALYWTQLNSIELDWTRLNLIDLDWTWLNSIALDCARLRNNHIYISSPIILSKDNVYLKSLYFSDHDALCVRFEKENKSFS